MGHAPTGNSPDHPLLPINWDEVDKFLQAGCSGAQVASAIGVSADTLYRRCQKERGASFSAVLQEKRAKGEAYIRLKQFSVAMKGDRGMLIWLGKQWLGQRDRPVAESNEPLSINIIHYGDHPTSQTNTTGVKES